MHSKNPSGIEKPIIYAIAIAALTQSISILIREFTANLIFPAGIDYVALHPSIIYLIALGIALATNLAAVKDFFACLPEKIYPSTIEGQKRLLIYEIGSLILLAIVFPLIVMWYGRIHAIIEITHPKLYRLLSYMPLTDVINYATRSFSFFAIFFSVTALASVVIPHTYLTYAYAKGSKAPLHAAIQLSILLSIIMTSYLIVGLSLGVTSWLLIALLLLIAPVILLSLLIINIVTLRYHDKFITC